MSWVSVEEIAIWMGQPLEDDDALRAQMVIDGVEALVIAYCRGKNFGSSPPADVKMVVWNEVSRTLNANPGILAENIGEIHTQYAAFRFGLSSDAKSILKPYRRHRFAAVSTAGGDVAI